MNTRKVITWLHLSDYHLNEEKDATEREIIIKELLRDIQNRTELSSHLGHIDFVLFTGDLIFHGWVEEFDVAHRELLKPLMEILQIKNNRVFIVPGNHEMHRGDVTPPREKLREKLLREGISLEDIAAIKKNKTVMKSIFRPFANYNEFIKNHFPHISSQNGYFKETLRLNSGMNIEIIGVNTAWLANGDKYDKGKLSVGSPFIVALMKGENEGGLKLLIMHHPIIWLNRFIDDCQVFESEIMSKVDLVFRGHEHEKNFQPHKEKNRLIIPGGASYSDDVLQRFWYSFGIYFVEEGRIEVHGREYRREGDEKKFFPMPWSPYPYPLERKKKPYGLGKGISIYGIRSSDLVQEELGEIPSKLKESDITYAEVVKRTEERYGIYKGIPLFKITSQYITLGAISLPSKETLTTISPENLFPPPREKIEDMIKGGPLMTFSGRQQDIIRTASEKLLSPISQSLLASLVSKMRRENKKDIENEFLGLRRRGIFRIEKENFPFTGEDITSIYLEEDIDKEISKPDNFSEKDKENILEISVELMEDKDLGNIERAWLLILLTSKTDSLSPEYLARLRKSVIEQVESPHPIYLWGALQLIKNKQLLLKFALLAPAQEIVRTRHLYAEVLLDYATISKSFKRMEIMKKCGEKAVEVLQQELAEEKEDLNKASILVKIGDVHEKTLCNSSEAKTGYNKGIEYLKERLDKAGEDEDKAKIWKAIGNIERVRLRDYEGAIKSYKSGLEYKDRWVLWGGIAFALEEQAKEIEGKGKDGSPKWKEAMEHHLNAIERIEEPEPKSGAWISVGDIRKEKLKDEESGREAYSKSIGCLKEALDKAEEDEDKAKIWEMIGDIERERLRDYEGAIKSYKNGFEYKDRWELWGGIAFALEEQAKEIEKRGEDVSSKWKEAVEHHLKAIEKIEEPEVKAQAWIRIGDIRKETLKDEEGGKEAYNKGIEYLKEGLDKAETNEEKAKILEKIGKIEREKLRREIK